MRGIRALVWMVYVVWAVAGTAPTVDAACNLVPDIPPGWMSTTGAQVPKGLPYRGRYGRVSQALVAAGVTEFIEVGPDSSCKSVPLAAVAGRSGEIAATLVYRNANGTAIHAHVIGSERLCNEARAKWKTSMASVSCASQPDALTVTHDGRVRIRYPADSKSLSVGGAPLVAPLSIVVFGVPKAVGPGVSARNVIDALSRDPSSAAAAKEGVCAMLAPTGAEFVRMGGFVCVDKLYRDPIGEPCDANSETLARLDTDYTNYCLSEITDVGPGADFAAQCSKRGNGSGPWRGERCSDEATLLPYSVTEAGCLLVPFDFRAIRGNPKRNRSLGGMSALRRDASTDSAIRLPGDEFVGSVPIDQDAVERNPARPKILVHSESNDVSLRLEDNEVDQDNSVVILAPRLLVSVRCKDGDTACQCFETEPDSASPGCSVGDDCRAATDAECKVDAPGFFRCVGTGDNYPDEGLPCTRNDHCGPSGECKPAVCVPKNEVWKSGWTPPTRPRTCRTDRDCARDIEQCGLSLFHISAGSYQLPADVNSGEGDSDGSCKAMRNTRRCSKSNRKCGTADKCVGYLLEAD